MKPERASAFKSVVSMEKNRITGMFAVAALPSKYFEVSLSGGTKTFILNLV